MISQLVQMDYVQEVQACTHYAVTSLKLVDLDPCGSVYFGCALLPSIVLCLLFLINY